MKQIFTLLTGLIVSISSIAQAKGSISGKIIDQQSRPMPSATVTLLKAKDSASIKFSVTDRAGIFQFENIPSGHYIVSVSSVGHAKAYSEKFEINETQSSATLKAIELAPMSKKTGRSDGKLKQTIH